MKHFYLVHALHKSFYKGYYNQEILVIWSGVIRYQIDIAHPAYLFKKLTIKRRL